MERITKTKKIKKLMSNKLFLEDGEVIDVNPDIIYYFKLKSNMDISDIYQDIIFLSIRQKALYYIYLKPRTKYELLSKLRPKYEHSEDIKKVIDDLEKEGYIDDVDFALSYILTHRNSRQKNLMKLMQKGISKSDIDEAFLQVPREQEQDSLKKEIVKLIGKYDNSQIFVKLTRKGYKYEDIKNEIKEMTAHN